MTVSFLRAIAASACAAMAACSFSGAGLGQGSGKLGDDDDGQDAGDDGGSSDPGTPSDESTTGDAGSVDGGPVGDTSTGPGDDTDGPPVVGGAHVVFVDGSTIDLGTIELTATAPFPPIVLRNDGQAAAEGLSGGALAPPLAWAGGAFPGTGGTCGGTLAPGQTCDLVLAPSPAQAAWGPVSQDLAIDYEDAGVGEAAVASVEVVTVATSDNLVANGSFTQGNSGQAPPSWMVMSGGWRRTSETSYDDSWSVFAGAAVVGTTVTLAQTVSLEPWADTIDGAGLGLRVEGVARVQQNDSDEWTTTVTQLDAGGAALATYATDQGSSSQWTGFVHEYRLEPGARSIRIDLNCVTMNGVNCNVWFDAVQARVSYPPPA